MILNEMLLGGYQSASTKEVSHANANSTSKYSKKSSSTFDMILGSKVSSASSEGQVSSKKNDFIDSTNKADRESFMFRSNKKINCTSSSVKTEAKNNASQDVPSMKECNEDVADNSSDTDDKSKNELSNDLISAISQILGISTDKLQQLLTEAGISPDMLLNEAMTSGKIAGLDATSDVMTQLSQLLGLNSEQQQTLSQLVQIAGDVISEAEGSNEKLLSTDITGNDIEPDAVADIQKNDGGSLEDDVLVQLSDIIKERLDELSKKLDGNEPEATDEIRRLIEPMTAKTNSSMQNISSDTEEDVIETATDGAKEITDTARHGADASTAGNESSESSEEESFSAPMEQKLQEDVDNIQLQPVFTELQNRVNVVQGAKSLPTDLSMQAKEILSQVIEKASVEITGGKSEMSFELKPESLGKISLKVVTENGIVMAKFVAENQQVKEVLESNMHLLKDSLESQGMNVQGFSVSVRQDSNRPRMNWAKQNDSRGSVVHGASARNSSLLGGLADLNSSGGSTDPYQWENSTINLTA